MKEFNPLKEIDQVKGVKAGCSKIVPDQFGKVFPARIGEHGGESVD